jgi:LssY C-terminus
MVNTPPPERKQNPWPPPPKRHRVWKRLAIMGGVLIVAYLVVAYFALPIFWMHYARHHPAFADIFGITHTADDIPGDPLNVALIGTATDLKKIMLAAQWYPADPLTLRSRLEIADAAVFEHPYDDAPVSNLFLWGRKEDLALSRRLARILDNATMCDSGVRPSAIRMAARFGSGRPLSTRGLASATPLAKSRIIRHPISMPSAIHSFPTWSTPASSRKCSSSTASTTSVMGETAGEIPGSRMADSRWV